MNNQDKLTVEQMIRDTYSIFAISQDEGMSRYFGFAHISKTPFDDTNSK